MPVIPVPGIMEHESFSHIDPEHASKPANLLALAFTWWCIRHRSIPYLPTGVPWHRDITTVTHGEGCTAESTFGFYPCKR